MYTMEISIDSFCDKGSYSVARLKLLLLVLVTSPLAHVAETPTVTKLQMLYKSGTLWTNRYGVCDMRTTI